MIRLLVFIMLLSPYQSSNKRILAIYTQSADNAFYKQQLQLLAADKPGLKDRNIVIERHIYSSQTAALFKKNRVTGQFTVTLTGKDRGEKYRSTRPVTLKKLYGTIDAMPMRKEEMKMK